jgi:hypothetical protein
MNLDKSINLRSYLYFGLFFLCMLAAFWTTYFTKLFTQENYRMHLHGIALILWCSMLVVQPYLIKTGKRKLHRLIGKFSYALVPVLLFTTYDLLRYRMNTLETVEYASVALVINALVAFIILYGLAIYFRKNPALHARYMICTVFPMFTPVTDRIISIYFPEMLPWFPTLMGIPNVPLFGFLLADIILIGLSIWDWKANRSLSVFPVALIILLIYHYSFNYFYQYRFWQVFSDWIMQ